MFYFLSVLFIIKYRVYPSKQIKLFMIYIIYIMNFNLKYAGQIAYASNGAF